MLFETSVRFSILFVKNIKNNLTFNLFLQNNFFKNALKSQQILLRDFTGLWSSYSFSGKKN